MRRLQIVGQPYQTDNGIVVPMATDDDKQFTVVITKQAINETSNPSMGSYTGRFSAFRGDFAKVATKKLELGYVEADGKIYVSFSDMINPELTGKEISN